MCICRTSRPDFSSRVPTFPPLYVIIALTFSNRKEADDHMTLAALPLAVFPHISAGAAAIIKLCSLAAVGKLFIYVYELV